jgi:hypothetical protein
MFRYKQNLKHFSKPLKISEMLTNETVSEVMRETGLKGGNKGGISWRHKDINTKAVTGTM